MSLLFQCADLELCGAEGMFPVESSYSCMCRMSICNILFLSFHYSWEV